MIQHILKEYMDKYPLLDYEKKLLFILIILTPEMKEENLKSCLSVDKRKILNYRHEM